MNDAHDAARARIRSLARISGAVLLVSMILLLLVVVLVLGVSLYDAAERTTILKDLLEVETLPENAGSWAMAAMLVGMSPILVALYALNNARRLMGGYRRGEIFTVDAARRLGRVGWAIFAMAPLSMLGTAAAGVLYRFPLERDSMEVSISFDDGDVIAIAFGLLLVVIGRVLGEAQRLSEENEAFV